MNAIRADGTGLKRTSALGASAADVHGGKTSCNARPMRSMTSLLLIVVLAGCATYRPLPLTRETARDALSPPDRELLNIEAKKIDHPLIRRVPIDLSDGLSPDEAAIFAVLVNPVLRLARDQKKIAAAQLLQAGILPNPELAAGVEVPTGGRLAGTVNAISTQLYLEVTALISRKMRINAARFHGYSVDLAVAWQEWQVAEEARHRWFRLFWLERKLALLREQETGLRESLGIVRRALALGEETASDLAMAEAAYRQARMARIAAARETEQEKLAFNEALGLPPGGIIALQEGVDLSRWPPHRSKEQALSGLESRRLDLLALQKGYQSQEARLRAAVLSQFPKIRIGVVHARDTGNVITTGLAVTVDIPLFDRNQGRIALEQATRQELFDEYAARLFAARSQVVTILNNMGWVRRQITLGRRAVRTQKRLLATYRRAIDQQDTDILSYHLVLSDLIGRRMELLALREILTDLGMACEAATGLYSPVTDLGRAARSGAGRD